MIEAKACACGCEQHDHATDKVRGMACAACNRGIAAFDDDVEKLRAAIAYLEAHR